MGYRVGIDFGTCFSFIAYCFDKDGSSRIHILINPVDRMPYEIPSVFFHGEKEKMRHLCGYDAIDHADNMRGNENEDKYVVRHIKQKLFEKFKLNGGEISPKEIVTDFFAYFSGLIKDGLHAEDHSLANSDEPIEAVISVPVVFTEHERSIIIEAAQAAGITVIGLIEEPIAIAIDYIRHLNQEGHLEPVIVYDLGGGTVDVACIKYHPNKTHEVQLRDGARVYIPSESTYEVIVSDGKRIGGVKWDEILSQYILDRCEEEYKAPPVQDPGRPFYKRVIETKHRLSKNDEINMPFTYIDSNIPQNRNVLITRKHFEEKTNELLKETMDCIRHVSSRCGFKSGTKVRVVLSGGSSRMPQVREGVLDILENEMGVTVINKTSMLYRHEKAVALGAARYADSLPPIKRVVTSSMFGIAIQGNETFLVEKGQEVPTENLEWTLDAKIENELEISVIERYDKVQNYLSQTDRIMSLKLKFDKPTSKKVKVKGSLAVQEGGIIKLSVVNPITKDTETRFFSTNSFPHPRRLKVKQ
ncbi:MAG: Hsp70 family protein [Defluviitaleaceae bacterium]|nr:Hsp70 family protein [Defluviitaleaceae bacterium]